MMNKYCRYKSYYYDDIKMRHCLKGRNNKINLKDYYNENILYK